MFIISSNSFSLFDSTINIAAYCIFVFKDLIFLLLNGEIQGSASPVLENIIERPPKHRSFEKVIPILGVPSGAVSSFVGFLYTSR